MSSLPLDINYKYCKACGICYDLCPKKAVSGDDQGKIVLRNPQLCVKCGICESHCPDYVIFLRR
ncbi:MAG: 2-oxoglutarate ferredoxin oxidoreductase subunit delta [Clostridia bacterium]|jgi:2-oxoglutarate ferredoxin oxidoreductase subunit delta|nr:2-oxoglutarate ferredoxin oxidoreductase subunit delta [Clostridia bacterium]MDN5324098.1 2-oxoglutarate ferredoxin oxidoreductase subunit delta [Clostridia bacterium]